MCIPKSGGVSYTVHVLGLRFSSVQRVSLELYIIHASCSQALLCSQIVSEIDLFVN